MSEPWGVLGWARFTGDVAALHKAHFGRTFRRIGGYVKLAQLGAVTCAGDLPEDARAAMGVYLGSGLGNVSAVVPLAEGILHAERPRTSPTAFAGSVGNAAAFFVARTLGVHGPNVTVSEQEVSFETALAWATLDLARGRVRHALVGGVDVTVGTDREQRQRLGVEPSVPGTPVAGSAFLLLGPPAGASVVLDEVWLGAADPAVLVAGAPSDATVLPGWRCGELPGAAPPETRLCPIATGLRLVDVLDGHESVATPRVVHVQTTAGGLGARVVLTRG